MAKFEDKDDDRVTILDIKNNLKNYSLKELKSLIRVLIDYVYNLTKDKDISNQNIDELEIENVELFEQLTKLKEIFHSLPFKNNLLNERLREIAKSNKKVKGEGSRIQFELEEKLTQGLTGPNCSLERCLELQRHGSYQG